jgi:hypothetical protein
LFLIKAEAIFTHFYTIYLWGKTKSQERSRITFNNLL